jgi:[ribosomal protein S18]-alanine N-acetyltransferase
MSGRFHLQLARTCDAERIALMSRDYIERGLEWSWTPRRVIDRIRCPETAVLTASEASWIVGFAIMEFGEEEAHLELLGIAPGYRRHGIGRSLVSWLEESALTAGISIVRLELRANNRGALHFYQRLGYRPIRRVRGYYQGREPAIEMARDLGYAVSTGAM